MVNEVKNKKNKITRQFTGEVVGVVENKTIRVLVKSIKTNEKYHKQYKVVTKYPVHDEKGLAKLGNLVSFVECRPLSKIIHFAVIGKVEEGKK